MFSCRSYCSDTSKFSFIPFLSSYFRQFIFWLLICNVIRNLFSFLFLFFKTLHSHHSLFSAILPVFSLLYFFCTTSFDRMKKKNKIILSVQVIADRNRNLTSRLNFKISWNASLFIHFFFSPTNFNPHSKYHLNFLILISVSSLAILLLPFSFTFNFS